MHRQLPALWIDGRESSATTAAPIAAAMAAAGFDLRAAPADEADAPAELLVVPFASEQFAAVVATARARRPQVPVLALLDRGGVAAVARALGAGATDAALATDPTAISEAAVRLRHRRGDGAASAIPRDLVDAVPGVVWEGDPATLQFTFVSAHAERLLGYPAAQWLDEPDFWKRHVHPEDMARALRICQQATAALADHQLDYRMIARDGRTVWIRDIVTVCSDGQRPTGLRGVMVDITETMRVAEDLRRSEMRLQTALALGRIGTVAIDLGANRAYVDAQVERMCGRAWIPAPGGVLDAVLAHTHADDRARLSLELGRVARGGGSATAEFRYLRPDDTEIWLLATVAADPATRWVHGAVIDVTELKRSEQGRRDEEERRNALFEASRDGIVVLDRSGCVLDANRRFAEMIGRDPQRVLGMHVWEWATRSQDEVLAILRDIDRRGQLVQAVHRRPDGTSYEAEIAVCTIAWRGAEGILCICRDVSERAAAAAALRDSEERARLLVENATDGVVTMTRDGDVLGWNREAERIFGLAAADAVGRPLAELVLPEGDRDAFGGELVRLVGDSGIGQAAERRERAAVRADGRPIQVELAITPLRRGPDTWLCAFVRDITARTDAERARASLEAQLRQAQKLEAIGTLAGGIAHDFNNVLAAIVGNAEFLADELGPGSPSGKAVAEILRATERATAMVRQILAFSRSQPVDRRRLCPVAIARDALQLLRATLPAQVALDLTAAEDTPAVAVDPTQLQQVLVNLVTNAWHACGSGPSRIVVEVAPRRLESPRAVGDRRLSPGDYVAIAVRDNGCGIEPALRERLFEPFFTTKPPDRGTGLGLSVVHGIVRGHDGAIDVESAPGCGSVFTVWLPAAGAFDPNTQPAQPGLPAGAGEHVLFLDDEPMLVDLGERALRDLGYRVSAFTQPAAALAALRADPDDVDAVITDYSMPRMTGLQVAATVRGIRPDLPVLLTSGYVGDEIDEADLGALAAVLAKPVRLGELATALARALAAARNVAGSRRGTFG